MDDNDPLAFTPVPLERLRGDGWTPVTQSRFIQALAAMGAVGPALRAVGKGRASAYKLRARPGAESFASAWDRAMDFGRSRTWDVMIERAFEGITTITVKRGGDVVIGAGHDLGIHHAAVRHLGGNAKVS